MFQSQNMKWSSRRISEVDFGSMKIFQTKNEYSYVFYEQPHMGKKVGCVCKKTHTGRLIWHYRNTYFESVI